MTAPETVVQQVAISLTHPARMRARASAHGLGGVELGPFRYLELHCGRGSNLLPLAARFPEASFVGAEPNGQQLAEAKVAAEACGISNVELIEAEALPLDGPLDGLLDGSAPFDYVVAHGIYSWVPEAEQRALLDTCGQALAPTGVACVSYNCMPGWSIRGVVRDLMLGAARGRGGQERLRAGRSLVTKLQRHLDGDHPYRALLAAELSLVHDKSDAELLDDHLADCNEPLYLADFVTRASKHGLTYLSELIPATPDGAMELEVPAQLMAQGLSRVEAEQCLDALCYRQLRATLLCREGADVREQVDHVFLAGAGYFAGRLVPGTEEPLLGPGKMLRFQTPTGVVIEADRPLLKAVLLVLADAWPQGLKAQTLVATAMGLLRERNLSDAATESEIDGVVGDLVQLCRRQQLELLPWTPVVRRDTPDRPLVARLTRWEAEQAPVITSARHEPVPIDAATRAVTKLLDGTRDLPALVSELGHLSDAGELSFEPEPPIADRGELLAKLVSQAVATLGKLGLLAPDAGD